MPSQCKKSTHKHIDNRKYYYLSNQKRQKKEYRAIFGSSAENAFWYTFTGGCAHLKLGGRLETCIFLSVCVWLELFNSFSISFLVFRFNSIEIIRRMYTLHLTWLFICVMFAFLHCNSNRFLLFRCSCLLFTCLALITAHTAIWIAYW